MFYIYLHGFASGPTSAKATYLSDRFRELGVELTIPDLNQGDFSTLTLSRQLQQVQNLLPPDPVPVTLIGSSFGGYTAAWIGEMYAQVQRLVMLAPAFQFLDHWIPRLGAEQMQQWQQSGYLQVYHYTEQRSLPLHYNFISDAEQYHNDRLRREIPTLIFHGQHDEVIPISASRTYAADRPWVKLVELNSDHALVDVQPEIWSNMREFCHMHV